jgi:hypothetical protein
MDQMEGRPSPVDGIVARAKAILMAPKVEWPKIAGETDSVRDVFMRYVVPLAAIAPVCGFIGRQLFGFGFLGFSYRPSLIGGLSTAITTYILSLVSIFVISWIASFLASKFDGKEDFPRAFRLCAYSFTAAWVVGIFSLSPTLGILGLLGLYSLYLFFLGATPMMGVPQDKAVGYTAVTVLCAIVLYFVVGAVAATTAGIFGGGAAGILGDRDTASGSLTIPGVGTIDSGKIEQANQNLTAAANGQAKPVDSAKLQALLPGSIGGYQRTALASNAVGQFGADVEGTYTAGDKSFSLKIVDSAGLGALAGLGAAMGVQSSHEDANGYERTGSVNGQMQSEKWDKSSSSGSVTQQVASRFMITAEGSAASVDDLKAAVGSIDQGRLAGLAS